MLFWAGQKQMAGKMAAAVQDLLKGALQPTPWNLAAIADACLIRDDGFVRADG